MKLTVFENLKFDTAYTDNTCTNQKYVFAVPHCKMCTYFGKKVNQYKFKCNALDHLMDNQFMQKGNCPSYNTKKIKKLL